MNVSLWSILQTDSGISIEVKLEHPSKHPDSIKRQVSGIVIAVNEVQQRKLAAFIGDRSGDTFCGNTTRSIWEQSEKIQRPNRTRTLDGSNRTDVRESQRAKQKSPTDFTVLGIINSPSMAHSLKASNPIRINPDWSNPLIRRNFLQPRKAPCPIRRMIFFRD